MAKKLIAALWLPGPLEISQLRLLTWALGAIDNIPDARQTSKSQARQNRDRLNLTPVIQVSVIWFSTLLDSF